MKSIVRPLAVFALIILGLLPLWLTALAVGQGPSQKPAPPVMKAPAAKTNNRPRTFRATLSCPGGAFHCAQLSWTAGTPGSSNAPTGFNVYRSTTTGGCSTVTASGCTKAGQAAATVTSLTDSPLQATTTYFWVITAFNTAGESGPSGQATGTTGPDPIQVPPTPTSVTVTVQ